MGGLRLAATVVALMIVASPAIASAEGEAPESAGGNKGDCPPGAWFCADAPGITPAAPAGSAGSSPRGAPPPSPASSPPEQGAAAPPVPHRRTPRRPPAGTMYAPWRPAPFIPPPPPPPPRRRRFPAWGLQLRFEGVMMGSGSSRASNAGMGGFGLSIRPRPIPHFALDIGIDGLSGTDFAGNERSEGVFSINPMVFVNPRSATQLYFLAGMAFSGATVRYGDQSADHFGYFGLDAGVGVEFRLSRTIALDVDLVGFVRDRTDRRAAIQPEFTDPATGRTTNTSGGGLFRLGLGFYW